ncbi:MAG: NupC/NupG family nucleoside CNT transporter [Arsenophonus sp.]|nr:MAG: NupC/NupG family nucleoside CNT transporter [Arsenophonus sp.]
MKQIFSLFGMLGLITIAVIFSNNRKLINFRTVFGAFLMQLSIGAFALYLPSGRILLESFSNLITNIISYGKVGMDFIFGGLVSNKMIEVFGGSGFIFAFRVLPVIVFFSALISVLYYLGIMQIFIKIFGGLIHKLLCTSRTESLSATANIFLGHTESPLVVKPYISTMTRSELFAVMCGGLSSVSGSVLLGYVQMGIPVEYLITASFMSAPGGLLFAKLLIPEDKKINNQIYKSEVDDKKKKYINIIDAAASGAISGIKLSLNVGATLLAFIALIALANDLLRTIGNLLFIPNLSLEWILGCLFSPIAFLIGIPWNEATIAGSFIGQKLVINEFVAYMKFSEFLKSNSEFIITGKEILSSHSKAIISFSLCGFANFASVAILIGSLGGIAPNRRQDVAKLSWKAILAGSLSNLMSANIAGFFLSIQESFYYLK